MFKILGVSRKPLKPLSHAPCLVLVTWIKLTICFHLHIIIIVVNQGRLYLQLLTSLFIYVANPLLCMSLQYIATSDGLMVQQLASQLHHFIQLHIQHAPCMSPCSIYLYNMHVCVYMDNLSLQLTGIFIAMSLYYYIIHKRNSKTL